MLATAAPLCMANGGTGIEGAITISPAHAGPLRVGEPTAKPLVDFAFAVEDSNGHIVGSFTTDAQGHFQIALAPAHYKVRPKETQSSIGSYGPWEVDVVAGKMTPVAWHCDSGMR